MENGLPTVDSLPVEESKPKAKPKAAKSNKSSISVPKGPLPGYVKRRVDVGRMTRLQAESLASITTGLQFEQERLKDGSPIKTEIHAIRWMLEQVAK